MDCVIKMTLVDCGGFGDGFSSNFKVSGVVVMIVFDLKSLFKSSKM